MTGVGRQTDGGTWVCSVVGQSARAVVLLSLVGADG